MSALKQGMNTDSSMIVIHARYPLSEQYKLAAETYEMLQLLAERRPVMHLSLHEADSSCAHPPEVQVVELVGRVNRSSHLDILLKTLLLYLRLPLTAWTLRRRKPALVFLSESMPLYGVLMKAMVGARVAVAFGDRHLHNMLGARRWMRPLLAIAERLERFELRKVDGIFTRGRRCADVPRSYGVPETRIRTVYDVPHSGVFNPRDATEIRRSAGFTEEDIVLSYHGVMHRGKGLDLLLLWVADLVSENPRLGLLLVGSGPEEMALRRLAMDLDLGDRVRFTGWLPTLKEVGDFCNAADITVAMRRGDDTNLFAISGAVIHSLGCGKITVAPDMPGMREILRHGENGFLFRPDDGDDFKRIIRDVVNRRADWPIIRERALQEVQEKYSTTAAAKQYADALEHFATPAR